MKKLLLITVLIICFLGLSEKSYSQSTKTYSFTLALGQASELNQLPQNLTVKSIKGSRIIVEIKVVSKNASCKVIDALQKQFRYAIDLNDFSFPNMQKRVFINGVEILEQIFITVYYPEA